YGRFHLADVDGGRFAQGRNAILKVDTSTLPSGSTFTTENPRVLHVTQALMSKISFGVKLPEGMAVVPGGAFPPEPTAPRMREIFRTVKLQDFIDPVRFASGRTNVTPEFISQLKQVTDKLEGRRNVKLLVIGHTDPVPLGPRIKPIYGDNYGLALARAHEVGQLFTGDLDLPAQNVEYVGRGPDAPIASNDTVAGRAQNRRVEIQAWYDVPQTIPVDTSDTDMVAGSGRQGKELPHGGIIWATEDPAVIDLRLNALADKPLRLLGGTAVEPVNFSLYSNYRAFIERWELLIYAHHDLDLVRPVAKLEGKSLTFGEPIEWDGKLERGSLTAGEDLVYVLRVHGADGHVDETAPRVLRVTEGLKADEDDEEEVVNGEIFGDSNLARQTIPVAGSRVRIHGVELTPDYGVSVGDEPVVVDADGEFAMEQYLPPGEHVIPVEVTDAEGRTATQELNVDVQGKYFFMVGLANVIVGDNDLSGNVEQLSGDERFDGDVYTDGRVAFYLKGKIKGRYLVTAQLDTTEDELGDIGDNLKATSRDPRSVFRRLDPDRYYPIYGDDSTTISDVDTQGAYYVRVDWDKSQALWGNYHTGITGNEFAQYNRSLYGARVVYRTPSLNKHGDHRFEGTAFGSEPLTSKAHDIFAATGGSLYYLRNTDLVDGSEKVWVEVRRRDTQQVVNNIILQEGSDYEIDYFQGRIILRRPLTQVSQEAAPSIIKDAPLEGDDVFLLADYEFVPGAFLDDEITAGGAGRAWLTDFLGIGGTYVQEDRNGTDYELKGVDATVKLGKGTYLKGEYAESESNQSNSGFLSTDGGLTFDALNTGLVTTQEGEAVGAEVRVNLDELTSNSRSGHLQGWWKRRDAGFSATSRLDDGIETIDTGVEARVDVTDKLTLSGRYTELDQKQEREQITASAQADMALTEKLSLGVELRREEENLANAPDADALLGGGRVAYRIKPETEVYVAGQAVIDDNEAYEDNGLGTIGISTRVNDKLALGAELSAGDRGEALIGSVDYVASESTSLNLSAGVGDGAPTSVGANYAAANGQELYGTYSIDPDRTAGGKSTLTLGQRQSYGDSTQIYTEHQFSEGESEAGAAQVFGLDYDFSEYWQFGFTFQLSTLENEANVGKTERHAAGVSAHYAGDDVKGSTRLEFRQDSGARDNTQWLTTNAIEWRQHPRLSWLGKLSYSFTEDDDTGVDEAKFAEVDLGAAYRPVFSSRLNLLGKYTYLYDLPSLAQVPNRPDERAHIFAVEALYDLTQRWELGAKLAYKNNELRLNRNEGEWFDSSARLAVVRGRYHLIKRWDALAEYRWLSVEENDDDKHGALLGVYRHFGDHFKIGAGYNFTDFNSDLSELDYDNHGWFVDLIGKY
ncbi:MAG: OmpA family protein, partial [Gammaproteobacteria bacterium]